MSNATRNRERSIEQNRSRAPIAGGVLVYEERDLGRALVGVEDVTDWDALADGLAARGHGRGAAHHLAELDDGKRINTRTEESDL